MSGQRDQIRLGAVLDQGQGQPIEEGRLLGVGVPRGHSELLRLLSVDDEAVGGIIVDQAVQELRALLGPQGGAVALQEPLGVLSPDLQSPGRSLRDVRDRAGQRAARKALGEFRRLATGVEEAHPALLRDPADQLVVHLRGPVLELLHGLEGQEPGGAQGTIRLLLLIVLLVQGPQLSQAPEDQLVSRQAQKGAALLARKGTKTARCAKRRRSSRATR